MQEVADAPTSSGDAEKEDSDGQTIGGAQLSGKVAAPTFVMTHEHCSAGQQRKRYSITAKIAVAEYSLQKDPNGRGPGQTIGLGEAARAYKVTDKMVLDWRNKTPEFKAKLQNAAENRGGKRAAASQGHRRSLNLGRAAVTADIDARLAAFIEPLRERDCKVSSRMVMNEAVSMKPDVYGTFCDNLWGTTGTSAVAR